MTEVRDVKYIFWDCRPGHFVDKNDGSLAVSVPFPGTVQEWYEILAAFISQETLQ